MKPALRTVVVGSLLSCAASLATAAPIWDTMPTDPATPIGYGIGSFGYWYEVAAGFTVSSAGYITHIDAAITHTRSMFNPYGSVRGFVLGIADASLPGLAAPPRTGRKPQGSIWETGVCSTTIPRPGLMPACTYGNVVPGLDGTVMMAEGEFVSKDTNIFLPSAGTYWMYVRQPGDDISAVWKSSENVMTDLIALRTGYSDGAIPLDNTFVPIGAARNAPGMRIEFHAVPEPASALLAVLALGVVAASHRSRRGKSQGV